MLALALLANLSGCISMAPPPLVKSEAASSESTKTKSENSHLAYETRPSISCENLQPLDQPRTFPLSLFGYLVGPTAQQINPKLKAGILRPFASDGCSFSPNGNVFGDQPNAWIDCCIRHDAHYWLGGTRSDRRAADQALKNCIGKKTYGEIAKLYLHVVEKAGTAQSSKIYRWGYGWNFRRSYREMTVTEESQIRALYGYDSKAVIGKVIESTKELVKYCDSFDPGLRKASGEESRAYEELNSKMKDDDTIEWAQWLSKSKSRRILEVKLKSCTFPTQIVFAPDRAKVISIDGTCPELLPAEHP
jgi:hypothetical protein